MFLSEKRGSKVEDEKVRVNVSVRRKVYWQVAGWKLLAYAFFLAMGSCFIYMTILVPHFLKPNLFLFDATIDDSFKVEHNQYEMRSGIGGKESSPRTDSDRNSAGDIYNWWDASMKPFLRNNNRKGNSFLIRHPQNVVKVWKGDSSQLKIAAEKAKAAGKEAWEKILASNTSSSVNLQRRRMQPCPSEETMTASELKDAGRLMVLPCGLQMGSSLTVIGKPVAGHLEYARIGRKKELKEVLVSQFVVELQSLRPDTSEDPPRVLHLNPRISGDWSGKPVIEINSCFHGQWGVSQRCQGSQSSEDDTVDGYYECEGWLQQSEGNIILKNEESFSWLKRIFGNSGTSRDPLWHYPFAQERFFVLTLRAGWEGYHIIVDGRHVASFAYREDFNLEDATGFYIGRDVDVHMATATSLPYPNSTSTTTTNAIELSEEWKSHIPKKNEPIDMLIGISSATAHFAERMAVRKTWMRSSSILSSKVMAKFFVALCADESVNMQVKEEADFYGDVIILPFIDHYQLVVLKTIAICEYGVRDVVASYIMKCDDDTFAHVDAIVSELKSSPYKHGVYMGNMNRFHRPQRTGKWAVTYNEWPEDEYPLYADGPGYVISADVAKFIVNQHHQSDDAYGRLRVFKMEDVSMGLWVSKFGLRNSVYYIHHSKFCQFGCVDEYYTAHYQSPRQMMCMWQKLMFDGSAKCCNTR